MDDGVTQQPNGVSRIMKACASCKAGNADDARFCNQCGAALTALVTADAAAVSYTPRHPRDGALRAAGAVVGERKHVPVLFAAIKGSTRTAAKGLGRASG